MSVKPGATEGPKVLLSAAKARKILKLLQRFHWSGPSAECDKLQYVIRFYARHQLVATDGICFHCGCFIALDPQTHTGGNAMTFNIKNANAKALDAYLANFFAAVK